MLAKVEVVADEALLDIDALYEESRIGEVSVRT